MNSAKTFAFRAARVLDWRKRQVDAARLAVMRAQESAREAEARVTDAEARTARAAADLRQVLAAPVGTDTIVRHRNWIEREQAHAVGCRRARDEARLTVNAALVVLQQAMRDMKMMERLRERALARHDAAARRNEMNALNELATSRFVGRREKEKVDRGH